MRKVVIDTNVFISSRLSSTGNPAKIMNLITDGQIDIYYSWDILYEYTRVLAYKKFNFSIERQRLAIDDIKNIGNLINSVENNISLPDESDRIFYDTAKASNAILITGNIKDFPDEPFILTPAEYISLRAKIRQNIL